MRLFAFFTVIFMTLIFAGVRIAKSGTRSEKGPQSCVADELIGELIGPTEMEHQLLAEVQGDLREVEPLIADKCRVRNAAVLKTLEEMPIARPSGRSKRKGTFSLQEVHRLYEDVIANKQVKKTLCGGPRYGGYRGSDNGFCFARAMAVHLKALQSGAVNGNVKKIWVMGDLNPPGKEFWYHVATIVRTDNGEWYVIDPDTSQALPLHEWHSQMQDWSIDGKMRLYVTPAKNFLPSEMKKYTVEDFKSNSEFFVDFLDAFYKENVGRPGPWSRVIARRKRDRLIRNALGWLGIAGFSGGVYYFEKSDFK